MAKLLKGLYWLVLLFYAYLVIETVFISRDYSRSINLIPFNSIREFIMVDNGIGGYRIVDINIWGNILMFVPAGIYIMLHYRNITLLNNLFKLIGISIFIELMQYIFSLGATDIDDVILNALGGLIGISIYKVFMKIFKEEIKIQKAISILSSIIGVPIFILFLILVIFT
ncbi:VanZ family protein [Lysinibacillus sp. NPDC097231]|uniref:VanZ family protein n=1 Tax=Lysinibacillus sp. NPDC097231 TaxID=3364142 RepID=UPI003801DF83